jgi:SAM-dependent methyltransferase
MTPAPLPAAALDWNQRYSQPGLLYGTEPNAWLRRQRHLLGVGQKALMVADGEGRNGIWLAQCGLRVDAFDLSEVAVTKARQRARQAGVTINFSVADAAAWCWPAQTYDHVVGIFIQFAAPRPRQHLFNQMLASLKPGGYLILQGYTPSAAEMAAMGPDLLDHLYTAEQLRVELAGADLLDLQAYQEWLPEQPQQIEPAALIGVLAQKRAV